MSRKTNIDRANDIIRAAYERYPEVCEIVDNFDLFICLRTAFIGGAEWADALPGLYVWNHYYDAEPQRGRTILVQTEEAGQRFAVWDGQNDDWRMWLCRWDITEWRYLDRIDDNDYEKKFESEMRLKNRLHEIDIAANKQYSGADVDFDAQCVEAFKIGAKWAYQTPAGVSAEEWRSASEEPLKGRGLFVITEDYRQGLAVWDGQYKRWNSYRRKWHIVKWRYLYPIEEAKSLMRYLSINRHAESDEVSKDEYPDSRTEQIAFKAGVIWADKHIAGCWRSPSEEPARGRMILVYRNILEFNVRFYYDYTLTRWHGYVQTWEQFAKNRGIVSWMYISEQELPETDELSF